MSVTSYCPRGPFCAFAHIERKNEFRLDDFQVKYFFLNFSEELKSYRDFDLHYTSELPLSSFIPIPEDKEVDINDVRFILWEKSEIRIDWIFFLQGITIITKHSKEIIDFRSWIMSRCFYENSWTTSNSIEKKNKTISSFLVIIEQSFW